MVSKLYQKNKNDPPVARDLPPIAGLYSVWFPLSYDARNGVQTVPEKQKQPTCGHRSTANRWFVFCFS